MPTSRSASRRHDDSPAIPVDPVLEQVTQDDQDEWEYEYSTTETEIYYLTVDLSHPGLKEQPTKMMPHSRGGYYKHWQDQHSVGGKVADKQTSQNQEEGGDNSAPEDDEPGNDDAASVELKQEPDADNTDIMLDPLLRAETTHMEHEARREAARKNKGKGPAVPPSRAQTIEDDDNNDTQQDNNNGEEEEQPRARAEAGAEEIQIMELHSQHPVISYRGRVFEASWAEVIGTEMLFTAHDSSNPLPTLRELAGDVDILAASCARLTTKEKKLKPRDGEEDGFAAARAQHNIKVPVGRDPTGERAQQARFLENLMALKKMRGDTDHVTIYAQDGEGKDFDDSKAPDYRPRRKKAAAQSASQRGTPARASGRGGRGGLRGLSTPTPAHWEHLSQRQTTADSADEAMAED